MVLRQRMWIAFFTVLLLAALAGSASAAVVLIDGSPGPSVPINTAPPRPVNPPAALSNLPGRLIVNTDNLSFRTGPGVEYTLVGVLDGGTALIALGTNGDANALWWFVEVDDLRGWVSDEFVVIRGNLAGLPVVEPEGEIIWPTFYVVQDSPVFNTYNPYSDPLCVIEGGLSYYVVGVDVPGGRWLQIETTCHGQSVNAWIQAERGALRNPANVPLPVISG